MLPTVGVIANRVGGLGLRRVRPDIATMSFHLGHHRHTRHAFEVMARDAFACIPEPFAQFLRDVVVRVEDFADEETIDALGLESKWGLSGLYHGRPLDEQSVWSSGELPPVITLYRMPLLAELRATGVELEELVRHVVIHEVGHHFGLSDEDMEELERRAR